MNFETFSVQHEQHTILDDITEFEFRNDFFLCCARTNQSISHRASDSERNVIRIWMVRIGLA